jgi:hypothetical protein
MKFLLNVVATNDEEENLLDEMQNLIQVYFDFFIENVESRLDADQEIDYEVAFDYE